MMSNLQSFVQHCAEDTAEVRAIWGNVPITVSDRAVEWESCVHVCLHISELSTEYSQNEWETFLFQSLRVSTDVIVTGEAKNGLPHSATSWCESKESGLLGVASSLKSTVPTDTTDGRRSTIRVLEGHPDVFTSSHHSGYVKMCWETWWGHQLNRNDKNTSQPELTAGATHTLHTHTLGNLAWKTPVRGSPGLFSVLLFTKHIHTLGSVY